MEVDFEINVLNQNLIHNTSGCNSTQSAKSASATNSSAFRGRNLTATRTLPRTMKIHQNIRNHGTRKTIKAGCGVWTK